jgi:hypothetical protein
MERQPDYLSIYCDGAIGEILGVGLAEIALDERRNLVALAGDSPGADELQDFIELG